MSKPRMLIICDKPQTQKSIEEIFARTAEMLQAIYLFMEKCANLDEDDTETNIAIKLAPDLEEFLIKMMGIYPSPDSLDADILTFQSVFINALRNKKQKGGN